MDTRRNIRRVRTLAYLRVRRAATPTARELATAALTCAHAACIRRGIR